MKRSHQVLPDDRPSKQRKLEHTDESITAAPFTSSPNDSQPSRSLLAGNNVAQRSSKADLLADLHQLYTRLSEDDEIDVDQAKEQVCAFARSLQRQPPPVPQFRADDKPASFLSLPPELRSKIYSLAARSQTLTLIDVDYRERPSPPAMLLVSKQIKTEYQPVLLSQAKHIPDKTVVPMNRHWLKLDVTRKVRHLWDWYKFFHSDPIEDQFLNKVRNDDVFADLLDPLRILWPVVPLSHELAVPEDDYGSDWDLSDPFDFDEAFWPFIDEEN